MSRRQGRKPNPYKMENEAWIEQKAASGEYIVLESGVLLRRLEEGRGTRCPKPSDIVFCNYTGRLIDGTVFDTTDGMDLPPFFRIRELIMGWQIALTRMHQGDRYEVIIPAKYGYGAVKMDAIPAHSTLVFDISLLKIE